MADVSPEALRAALHAAGIPDEFSVVPVAQVVPQSVIRAIDDFIAVFDRVTTRSRWQQAALETAPAWLRQVHDEVCFFSAWDFHVPPDDQERWQLIELNDNGSGFLFAAILDRAYYELAADTNVEPPGTRAEVEAQLLRFIDHEIAAWFGDRFDGRCLILDDADSLARGHFRVEHEMLAAVLRRRGWDVSIGAPEDMRDASFVVNRSTDFLWQGDAFEPLRRAFEARTVYVAPNPFTYLTRSDKRLLELLSSSEHDAALGIEPAERAMLAAHVPETRLLREENLDELVRRKHELFFKPAHGHASHGTISGEHVGHARLHRLLRAGEPYVAQRFVPRSRISVPPLLADLRVWAYRGERYLVSGRAAQSEEHHDLSAGGWIPTFVTSSG